MTEAACRSRRRPVPCRRVLRADLLCQPRRRHLQAHALLVDRRWCPELHPAQPQRLSIIPIDGSDDGPWFCHVPPGKQKGGLPSIAAQEPACTNLSDGRISYSVDTIVTTHRGFVKGGATDSWLPLPVLPTGSPSER